MVSLTIGGVVHSVYKGIRSSISKLRQSMRCCELDPEAFAKRRALNFSADLFNKRVVLASGTKAGNAAYLLGLLTYYPYTPSGAHQLHGDGCVY